MPGSPAPATSRAPRPGAQQVREPGPGGGWGGGWTHGQVQLDGVHGLVEGPGELVLPQRLHHHVLHVLQLVRLAAGLGGVGDLGRGRVHGARGHWHPRGGGRRRGGHRPGACSLAVAAAAQGGPRFLPVEARHPISRPDQAAPGGEETAEEGGHLRPCRLAQPPPAPRTPHRRGKAHGPGHANLTCHRTTQGPQAGHRETRWQKAT